MSFIDSINAIETRLKNFQPLKDFLQATFNKTLLVKKTVRDRTTVGQDEFPLIMITRPRIERVRAGNSTNLDNSVFLYAGISQPDRNIALEQMIRSVVLRIPRRARMSLLTISVKSNPRPPTSAFHAAFRYR